jgi:hypothetical protein
MKNVVSFFISKFQDLSNGILETQFGPYLLFALLFQKFKIHIFKVGKSLASVRIHFLTFFVVCSNFRTFSQPTCPFHVLALIEFSCEPKAKVATHNILKSSKHQLHNKKHQ